MITIGSPGSLSESIHETTLIVKPAGLKRRRIYGSMDIQKTQRKQVGNLTVTETIDRKHQEDLQRLRGFRLMDDDFLTKCFEGNTECIELVLRIVLDMPDLNVLDVRTQVFVENLLNRSVRLDVLATDSAGRKFNIEIQRADKGAGRKRARYNSSMMDANLLKKGEDFDNLPETYVVFITENDVIGKGKPLYQIARCILETGERFEDGTHILYVNGAYRDESPIGKLMHDFSCTNPSDMYYGVLADRVKFFKESKEGIAVMCKAMEDMRNQTLKEGMVNVAKRMLADGTLTLEKIAEYAGLSLDEVKKLKADKTA